MATLAKGWKYLPASKTKEYQATNRVGNHACGDKQDEEEYEFHTFTPAIKKGGNTALFYSSPPYSDTFTVIQAS